MLDYDKIAKAYVLLLAAHRSDPAVGALASLHRALCDREELELSADVLHLLNELTTGYSERPRHMPNVDTNPKVIFAMLNPLLWSVQQIADHCNDFGSTAIGWITTYRSQVRTAMADPNLRRTLRRSSLPPPINPRTGLYCCEELADIVFDDWLYLYHAQRWACARYARELEIAGHGACQWTAIPRDCFVEYANANPVILAREHDFHYRPFNGVTLLRPSDNTSKHFTHEQWLKQLLEYVDRDGFASDDPRQPWQKVDFHRRRLSLPRHLNYSGPPRPGKYTKSIPTFDDSDLPE